MDYEKYLQSEHWLDVRRRWIESGRPINCIVCGHPDYQLHHKTYERLGREELGDLEPLCGTHHRERHGLEENAWQAFTRTQRDYRKIFVESFGPFETHHCYFCGKALDGHVRPWNSTATVVHHQDGDRANNYPLNLKPAHLGCHSGYHGRNMSTETRARLRDLNRVLSLRQWEDGTKSRERILAAIQSPEYAAKMADIQRHKWRDPEERAKRIAGLTSATRTPEFRALMSRLKSGERNGYYGRTHTAEMRAKMRAGQKNAPRASCVLCRRTLTTSNIHRHVEACRRKRPT